MPERKQAGTLAVGDETLRFGRITAPSEPVSEHRIRIFGDGCTDILYPHEWVALKETVDD